MEWVFFAVFGLISALLWKVLSILLLFWPLPGLFFGVALIWRIEGAQFSEMKISPRASWGRDVGFVAISMIICWIVYFLTAMAILFVDQYIGIRPPCWGLMEPCSYAISPQSGMIGSFFGGLLGAFLVTISFKMLLDPRLKYVLILTALGGLLAMFGILFGPTALIFIWQIGMALGLGVAIKYS